MVAVTLNGNALMSASEALHRDKEVVLAALTQLCASLYFASGELSRDKEVVLIAVAQNIHLPTEMQSIGSNFASMRCR